MLTRVDNEGEILTLDTTAGVVSFSTRLENAVINSASGTTATATIADNTVLENVTFNADAVLNGVSNTTVNATVESGLTVNGSLEIASVVNRTTRLDFNGEQTIDGSGEIVLSDANLASGQTGFNSLRQVGVLTSQEEVLTFGPDLTLRGTGTVTTNTGEDRVQILGDVVTENGALVLTRIDNQGAAFTVDAAEGSAVVLSTRIENAVIDPASSLAPAVSIADNTVLENVTFNADAVLNGVSNTTVNATVESGLTVNGSLSVATFSGRTTRLEFSGEQTIGGSGEIVLSDANLAPGQTGFNTLTFTNQLAAAEVLTIGSDLTIRGEGTFGASGSTDTILLEGTLLADDGDFGISDFAGLEGVLGATADGVLIANTPLILTERGTLQFGIAGPDGAEVAGLLTTSSALDLAGTLRLDVDEGYVATLGDTFDLITTDTGFSGAFDAFENFDLDGNLAFTLDQTDPETVSIRVVTDAEAQADGVIFADQFLFES